MPNNSFFDIKLFCSVHHRIEISFPTAVPTEQLDGHRQPHFPLTLYLLILYNPGWNEPKLISPKMQVNFFPNQNYLSKKRKKI